MNTRTFVRFPAFRDVGDILDYSERWLCGFSVLYSGPMGEVRGSGEIEPVSDETEEST